MEPRCGDPLAPMPFPDEVAGDPPVRQGPEALLVGGPVLDLRHLVRRAELTPTHTVAAIEHQGRMRRACPHACELAFPVQRWLAAVIGVKAHAPATPKDAVIRLDQSGERIPARLVESLDRVPRPPLDSAYAGSRVRRARVLTDSGCLRSRAPCGRGRRSRGPEP